MTENYNKLYFTDLINSCWQCESNEDLHALLDTLFTISEKAEFANRLQIIKALLAQNKPQREIAKELKVSLPNVSRGSNTLKATPYNLKKILNIK